MNSVTQEKKMPETICPFPTFILLGARALALKSLRFIPAYDYVNTNNQVCLKLTGIMLQTIHTSHLAKTEINITFLPLLIISEIPVHDIYSVNID